MSRDWLLTLLAMSPFLLTATIAVLAAIRLTATIVVPAVIRKLTQTERIRHAAETSAPLRRSGSVGGRE